MPVIDGGLAAKNGVGQIGAGILKAPIECFHMAAKAWIERYGDPGSLGQSASATIEPTRSPSVRSCARAIAPQISATTTTPAAISG